MELKEKKNLNGKGMFCFVKYVLCTVSYVANKCVTWMFCCNYAFDLFIVHMFLWFRTVIQYPLSDTKVN